MRALLLGLATLAATTPAQNAAAYDVLATVFQFGPPSASDPDPSVQGVVRINTVTGAVSPFFTSPTSNVFVLSDVAVNPLDNNVYVSNLGGQIERYTPGGDFIDVFGSFTMEVEVEGQIEVVGDGVNRLSFAADGTLFAATGSGTVAEFNPAGVRQADLATDLGFTTGVTVSPGGDLFVTTGGFGEAGVVSRVDPTGLTTIIPAGVVGGASNLTFLPAAGDYNADNETTTADLAAWQAAVGTASAVADGNGDGVVNTADYAVYRDNLGDTAQLLVADFSLGFDPSSGNRIFTQDLVTGVGETLATIPVALPDPLPPFPTASPSNFPSEVLLSPEGTLLVSTSGPSQRPLNGASLLEFAVDGTFLRRIDAPTLAAGGLPPLSGIALAPPVPTPFAVPEPTSALLLTALAGFLSLAPRR